MLLSCVKVSVNFDVSLLIINVSMFGSCVFPCLLSVCFFCVSMFGSCSDSSRLTTGKADVSTFDVFPLHISLMCVFVVEMFILGALMPNAFALLAVFGPGNFDASFPLGHLSANNLVASLHFIFLPLVLVDGEDCLEDELRIIGDTPSIGKGLLLPIICSCSILSTTDKAWVSNSNPNDELKSWLHCSFEFRLSSS